MDWGRYAEPSGAPALPLFVSDDASYAPDVVLVADGLSITYV
jgi:hypothetical protein